MQTNIRRLSAASLVFGALAFAACGDEVGEAGHTPHDAQLLVGSAVVTPNVTLQAGQTVRVEVRFLADDGDVIPDLDTEHFAALTFAPASLATVATVAGQRFFFDVTAQAGAGVGTLHVGYGHDAAADGLSFGPFNVTVQ